MCRQGKRPLNHGLLAGSPPNAAVQPRGHVQIAAARAADPSFYGAADAAAAAAAADSAAGTITTDRSNDQQPHQPLPVNGGVVHSRGWRGRSFSFGTFTNGGVLVQPPPQPPQQTLARPPYGNWRGQKPNGPPPPFHATTHSWLGNDTDSWAGSDDDGAMAAIGASPYGTVTLGHLPLPQPQQEQPQPQPQQQQPQQQQQPWGLSMLPWGPGMSNAAPPPLWLQPPSFHPTPHPALGNAATPAASATATANAAAVAAYGYTFTTATAAAAAAAAADGTVAVAAAAANANAATATAVCNSRPPTATAAAGVAAAAAAHASERC